jgi:hypothetical protein
MSEKPFDPFRYSVETVPPLVRKDLARMTVPELPAGELEPPAGLKQRLGSVAEAPPPLPQRLPTRTLILALALVLACAALAVFRG